MDLHHPWHWRPYRVSEMGLLKISCEENSVSKMEESKYEGHKVACLASSDLEILSSVEDQPDVVVESQWRVGCVMRSCACLSE